MTHFKRIFGHNQPEIFPVKPLPPIFLGPPKPNGAIAAPERIIPVYAPPPGRYVPPGAPEIPTPGIPEPPAGKKSTLWGLVTDCVSGVGLPDATVVLNGVTVKTDSVGKYEFKDVEPGNYVLYIYKE